MKTEDLFAILKDRGLRIEYGPDGPHLKGDGKQVTPRLLRVLKIHREEIDKKLKPPPPKPTRRVVLLTGGKGSKVERVLLECSPGEQHLGLTRRLAAENPGRMVAAEWLHILQSGEERWEGFLWIPCQEVYEAQAALRESLCPEPPPTTNGT